VIVEGHPYIVDAGPGVVRRTSAARRAGLLAFVPKNLDTVFITHLHSDHTLGLPDLIFSPWTVGRTAPLQAYGPSGLKKMVANLEAAYAEDIAIRTEGLEHGNRTGYEVVTHEIEPGVVFHNSHLSVSAFLVKHGSWKEAYGYKFVADGKTIVLSGDTAPCDELVKQAKGADILVHEVYAMDEAAPEGRNGGSDWPTYLHAFHTSTVELGREAAICKPKLLVLTHVLRRNATDDEMIAEIRRGGFTGKVVVAKDLDAY
jgi:ribonuclease BN (tRNA processing enzyme)